MSSFALFQPAIAAFACGLALLWTAVLALRLTRSSQTSQWRWFALFAVTQALAQWSLLATSYESWAVLFGRAALVLSAVSFLALIEFGRLGIKRNGERLLKPWIYAPVAAVAAFVLATSGPSGVDAALRYTLAAPAGLLAAVALAQAAQGRRATGGLALVSAASALFAIGYMFSVGVLQAFAASGLLFGIWRESREAFPLPPLAGAIRRWRSPAAFVLFLIVGATVLLTLNEPPSHETAAVGAVVLSNADSAAEGEAGETLLSSIDIDPRQLARQRADEQRYQQGLSILIVLGVIAVVWIGLAKFAGAK